MDITSRRIRELREDKGLTQKVVADYLKVDRGNYGKYERGILEVNLTMLRALARFYNVTGDYLLGLSDDFSPREN